MKILTDPSRAKLESVHAFAWEHIDDVVLDEVQHAVRYSKTLVPSPHSRPRVLMSDTSSWWGSFVVDTFVSSVVGHTCADAQVGMYWATFVVDVDVAAGAGAGAAVGVVALVAAAVALGVAVVVAAASA